MDAQAVLAESVERVCLLVRDGLIERVSAARPLTDVDHVIRCDGDYVLPGFIELHTDNVERHLEPRPGVFRAPARAVLSHDAELAASGITTAFEALTIGADIGSPERDEAYLSALDWFAASAADGLLRVDHRLHLRCELSGQGLPERLHTATRRHVPQLLSLMDHTPGQGQWDDIDRFRRYYSLRYGMTALEIDALIERRQAAHQAFATANRALVLAFAREHDCIVASHDAASWNDVAIAQADGCGIIEFPTSLLAACRARELGLGIVAGAPNLVRGGSHSGNVSAATLAEEGLIDVLSSDYCPAALLEGVFQLVHAHRWPLHRAVAAATSSAAKLVGLTDRGAIAAGQRADLIRVRDTARGPIIISVWSAGRQVA